MLINLNTKDMEELFKKCDHSHIQYIPALNEWLCLKCRAFSKDKDRFNFQPLPQPREVTDEEIKNYCINMCNETIIPDIALMQIVVPLCVKSAKWMREQMKGGAITDVDLREIDESREERK
jgi:hypothetical protein